MAAGTLDIAGARLGNRLRGLPRWTYAAAAVAGIILLFGAGTLVTRPRTTAIPVKGAVEPASAGSATSSMDRAASSAGSAPAIAPAPPVTAGEYPPKVVRNADIQVQVRRGGFDRAWQRALNVASRYGGFVTNTQAQQTDDRISSGTFTVRVPAAKLDGALADLRKLGTLKSLSTTGSDVSGQVVDLDARIRADEAQQAQLLDLMKQATRVSDMLPIRTQLAQVQQELESLRGQKKLLANQVDYATINATIFERGALPDEAPVPADEGIIARGWHAALTAGLTVVAGTLVVLGGLIPLTVLGVAVWALVAYTRRRRVS